MFLIFNIISEHNINMCNKAASEYICASFYFLFVFTPNIYFFYMETEFLVIAITKIPSFILTLSENFHLSV